MDLKDEAEALLRRLVGNPAAAFRDGQWEAVRDLVDHQRRVLVVQRTGWGKSAVYFVATGLLRARGRGPTVIVSPLLALMRDQIAAAEKAGVRAVTINSANADQWGEVAQQLADDAVDVLLVSPERLNNPRFREEQLPALASGAGLVVVDEAHCVSDWGHDFRPDYRRIRDLLDSLPGGTPVLATTATANARVVTDVAEQLGSGGAEVRTVRGSLARDSLRLGVLTLPSSDERLGWLLAHLNELPGSGIIYALTVSAAEDTAALLHDAGHRVLAYTGRTDPADRIDAERALLHNEVKALVATSALGMGFDKPDLGFVVHLGAPPSPVAYYQQVGRAGRATERADVLLLPGAQDKDIWHYFATVSMPQPEQAEAVISALTDAGQPMSTAALETVADVRRTRLELLLKVLDVDGAVRRVRGGWEATGRPWVYDAERYARVAATRTDEAQMMLTYQRGDRCRMAFLQEVLDDPAAAECGRCDVCAGAWYSGTVPDDARASARNTLDRAGIAVEPRAQWPSGMGRLGVEVRGKIPDTERVEPGRAVARLTDLGWGQRLREVLGEPDAPAGDALLTACVDVLRDWDWEHRPHAVAWMPSYSRPKLIQSVAQHLAGIGRLRELGPLESLPGPPPGEPGGNSAFRLAGVWGRWQAGESMRASLAELGSDPVVLLVDDLIDSRWTITVAGQTLRQAGAGQVLPFALAVAA
ncbi:RecQ family ATP-dependent DNA helicase [Phytoactinopolyspora mesophila]|uniref:DNA 3'-5' helicase n=1 Tax=Phytoactinopolyspora mesophila TaxID=2650750 RepID=A0A7K3M750_9ACTN|nr:DEAD/DEAH box helicase [Phytoactinopolyspora mesophila]NDL59141.1 DEAD/DEAH box helicase [Phytoactinopolyspora mesophila]